MNYTLDDYHANRCTLDEVGTSIPTPTEQEELNMAEAIRAAFKKAGGQQAFEAEFAKNPSALYQAVLKMGVAQAAKQETPSLPELHSLTDSDIEALSSLDLKRILLKHVGATTKEDIL